MIDNNIIQSLGAGSGIDTKNLVKQLVEVERYAPQQRIDTKTALSETRISDFGLVSSALSTLRDAAKVLTDPEALFSKTASFTESDALVPVELGTDVEPGSYSFNVSQIAKSHTLAFTGFADASSEVGEGTLSFNFGSWDRSGLPGVAPSFTQDSDSESFDIVIDSENNSLKGLRDAINAADKGVTASIVYDGSSYILSVVSDSGVNNELEITAAESGVPTNNDESGLSYFSYNVDKTSGADTFIDIYDDFEKQAGQNSQLTLNGISISRETNTIGDIVDGLTIDVLKTMAASDLVTITVKDDKAFAEQNVRDFVAAYNEFLTAVKPVFGETEKEDEDGKTTTVIGSLANDSLAKSLLSQMRNVIASSIPGLAEDSTFSSLTNMGIRTALDGTLSINEKDFKSAFENNFDDVKKLLAANKESTSDEVKINSFNTKTSAGQYEVAISQAPTRGLYEGGVFSGIGFPLDASLKDYSFVVSVDGVNSTSLSLAAITYDDENQLALALQSLINNDANLKAQNKKVDVSFDLGSGGFDIQSRAYGASSNVGFVTLSQEAKDDLGLTETNGTAGLTVAGTVDGVAAFGSGQILLPSLGSSGEGLAMLIGANATTATVNFSRGFAGELERLIDSFLGAQGVIATRTQTLEKSIDTYDVEQERLDRRMTAYEDRLLNQFIAMERILSSLDSSGGFLDNLIDTLPFTAKSD